MDSQIFRKVSLERLSSPEQLDVLLKVTNAKGWLALIACMILIVLAIVWGFVGEIPHKVRGQGILVKSGGIYNVASLGAGQLTSIYTARGDMVKKGQIVARIAQPELVAQIVRFKADLEKFAAEDSLLETFGNLDEKLQADAIQQQRKSLEQIMENAQEQIGWLEDKLKAQEKLLEKGLITEQSRLDTRQKRATAEQMIDTARNQLKDISVKELDIQKKREEVKIRRDARIREVEQNIKLLEDKLDLHSRVFSPYSGRVLEVRGSEGDFIEVGSPLVIVELTGNKIVELEALLYVPAAEGKKIHSGMKVAISPSTVKPEEHGYMIGIVTTVAEFPTSRQAMTDELENPQLVDSFIDAMGAPIEIRASLVPKAETPTGYLWSSPMGPPSLIQTGTLCAATITVEQMRPIEMIIPYLKNSVGM